ncbi:Hypothetical_protein [Hexamita inflata]|uniref:Hypothetical_protein n=1 Tax=Hexamita inflata TaxID=28002 RepID=A0AA86Q8C9_9EUKA|nr:Hypothetical protein HINF_LOCUS38588 [Hexamita inflata]CAI9950949.1 Hypothetical protein HINF_LOCUS38594 [Hexamita inflata]
MDIYLQSCPQLQDWICLQTVSIISRKTHYSCRKGTLNVKYQKFSTVGFKIKKNQFWSSFGVKQICKYILQYTMVTSTIQFISTQFLARIIKAKNDDFRPKQPKIRKNLVLKNSWNTTYYLCIYLLNQFNYLKKNSSELDNFLL